MAKPKHIFKLGATVNNINIGSTDTDKIPSGAIRGNQPVQVKAGEFNYNYNNTKIKTKGRYAGSETFAKRYSNTQNTYYPQYSLFNSKEQFMTNTALTNASVHKGSLSIDWRPSRKYSFNFAPSFAIGGNNNANTVSGLTMQDVDTVSRSLREIRTKNSNYSLGLGLVWRFTLNKKGSTIVLNSNSGVSGGNDSRNPVNVRDENYNAVTRAWSSTDLSSNRLTDGSSRNTNLRASVQYLEPFFNKEKDISRVLQINMNINRERGKISNYAYSLDSIGMAYTQSDNALSTSYNKNYNTLGGGITYRFNHFRKQISYTVQTNLNRYNRFRTDLLPLMGETNQEVNEFAPLFSVTYKSKYSFRYSGQTLLPSIESQTPYIYDIDPMNLIIGNPKLKNGYSNNISLGYGANSDMFSANLSNIGNRKVAQNTVFGLSLNAGSESNPISVNRIALPIDRDTVIFVSDNPQNVTESGYNPQRGAMLNKYVNLSSRYKIGISTNMDFSVPLTKNIVKLMLAYNYRNALSQYQGKLNKQNGHSLNLSTTITSYAWENIDYTIRSQSSYGYTDNTVLSDSKFFSENLSTALSVVLPLDFITETNFNWFYSKSFLPESQQSSVGLLNFSAGKLLLKNRNLKVVLNVYDLFNQSKSRRQIISSDNDYISYIQTNTFGRYLILRFTYKFNSLKRATQDELRQKYFEDNKQNVR